MRYGISTGIHMLRLECMKNVTPKCVTTLRQENVILTLKDINQYAWSFGDRITCNNHEVHITMLSYVHFLVSATLEMLFSCLLVSDGIWIL